MPYSPLRIGMLGLKGIPYPAGIENFTEQVGWRLVARGHEVTVYVRPYVDVGHSHRGVRIRHLPSIQTKHFDALTHTFLASLDVLFAGLDVVHYHALGPSVFSFVPRLRGVRTVAQVHALDWQRAKWNPFARACLRRAEACAVRFPNRTIAISNGLKAYLERKYGQAVDYVPTGVEIYEPYAVREIAKWGLAPHSYVLFLSRVVPEKGCHHLIAAYERLRTDKLLVVAGPESGEPEYYAALRRTCDPRIRFVGGVTGDALHELFSNAYTYVVPSDVEGLSHALLQGLSHGRCVLASDIDANLEALGGCGLTFRSGDVDDLSQKLQFLIDNPSFVHGCGAPARARIRQHYSWDHVVDRLEAIYASCCLAPAQSLASAS